MRKTVFCMALIAAGCALAAPISFTDDLNRLLSKLQGMGRDSYSQAEWKDVHLQLEDLESRAKAGGAWDGLVQARIVHAMVLGDMQRNYQAAADLLQETRRELRDKNVPAMRNVFVRLAEVYGKMGDETAVNRTIDEFRASPYFDPQDYPFSGGKGPTDPLKVMRPNAGGSGSISETSMKVQQTKARFGIGAEFPDFDLLDAAGTHFTRQSIAGKVTLVDFWSKDWTAWKNDLKNLSGAYARHGREGFEILGINLAPDAGDTVAFCKANGMTWPQVGGANDLARKLGLFGECGNFLVDRNGVIIGRNLRGADLIEAVKKGLAK